MVCPLLSAFLILLGRNWIRCLSAVNWRSHPKPSGCGLSLCCEKWILYGPFFFGSRPLPFIYLKACPAGSLLFSLCFCSVPSVCALHLPKHSPSKQTFEQAHLEPNTVESQILTLFGLGRVTVIRLLGVWIERWFMMRAGHRVCVPSGRGLSSVCPGLILRRRRLSLT